MPPDLVSLICDAEAFVSVRPLTRKIAAVTAAAALVLSGCGRFAPSSPASGTKVLRMWTEQYTGGNAGLEAALKAFTAKTGIKVQYTAYSTDGLKQALKNAEGTSAMPDVFQSWTGIGLTGPYMEAKAVEPLGKYYAKYGWTSKLLPGAVKIATFNGQKMAVPFDIHGMAIVYRKDLFAKAGITTLPTTYSQLLADNAKLKAHGIIPFSLAGQFSWDTMRLLDSLLDMECGAATFDQLRALKLSWTKTPCAQAGFTQLRTWVKNYLPSDYMGLNPNSNQQYTAMLAGKAAMTIDGDWSVRMLQQDKQNLSNWGFFPFPTGTGQLAYFTESLWMSSTSPNKNEAAELINFLVSKPIQEKYFNQLNTIVSPTKGVTTPASVDPLTRQWIATISKYSSVFQPSDQAFPPTVAADYLQNQDDVVLGKETPAQAVAAFQTDISNYESSK
jgi:raffinose/stachyose/melibiose transport system substrate-binding protein